MYFNYVFQLLVFQLLYNTAQNATFIAKKIDSCQWFRWSLLQSVAICLVPVAIWPGSWIFVRNNISWAQFSRLSRHDDTSSWFDFTYRRTAPYRASSQTVEVQHCQATVCPVKIACLVCVSRVVVGYPYSLLADIHLANNRFRRPLLTGQCGHVLFRAYLTCFGDTFICC